MTLKGGTSQACAACKYQRRKCTPGCQLAPYFPPDKPKMFANAHKLFGVSNIVKILKHLDPSQHSEAMSSIIYEANIRDMFPVRGCIHVIESYWYDIRQCQEELQFIQSCKALYQQQQQQQNQEQIASNPLDSPSQLQLGMGPPSNDATTIPFYHHNNTPLPPLPLPISVPNQPYQSAATTISMSQNYSSYSSSNSAAYNNSFGEATKENNAVTVNPIWIQQQIYGIGNNSDNDESNNNINSNMIQFQSQLTGVTTQQQQQVIQQEEVFQDYDDEINPYFDTIDDRQSFIDSKVAYDSSPESSIRDPSQSIEHVAENELKSAAACFSLTSV